MQAVAAVTFAGTVGQASLRSSGSPLPPAGDPPGEARGRRLILRAAEQAEMIGSRMTHRAPGTSPGLKDRPLLNFLVPASGTVLFRIACGMGYSRQLSFGSLQSGFNCSMSGWRQPTGIDRRWVGTEGLSIGARSHALDLGTRIGLDPSAPLKHESGGVNERDNVPHPLYEGIRVSGRIRGHLSYTAYASWDCHIRSALSAL